MANSLGSEWQRAAIIELSSVLNFVAAGYFPNAATLLDRLEILGRSLMLIESSEGHEEFMAELREGHENDGMQ